MSRLTDNIRDIFLLGIDRAVDNEVNERFGVNDPSRQIESDPGQASQIKGTAPGSTSPMTGTTLLLWGVAAAVALYLAVK